MRPIPACISSTIRRAPVESANFRASAKNSCDNGEGKLSRVCHWLFYIPEKAGCLGCCCNGWIRPQVPFYAYFPCHAGGCGSACASCSAGHTAVAHGTLAHATDGGEAQSSGATASPARISTYKPAGIAKQMPVLAPEQFKQPTPPGACSACQR